MLTTMIPDSYHYGHLWVVLKRIRQPLAFRKGNHTMLMISLKPFGISSYPSLPFSPHATGASFLFFFFCQEVSIPLRPMRQMYLLSYRQSAPASQQQPPHPPCFSSSSLSSRPLRRGERSVWCVREEQEVYGLPSVCWLRP